jgi:hypothetical protein
VAIEPPLTAVEVSEGVVTPPYYSKAVLPPLTLEKSVVQWGSEGVDKNHKAYLKLSGAN